MVANGMERKCVTCGVAARPVRGPMREWVKFLVTGGVCDILGVIRAKDDENELMLYKLAE